MVFNKFFFLIALSFFTFPLLAKFENSNINDKRLKFYKETLKLGMEYSAKKNIKILKEIIIGKWAADSWGDMTFFKNGIYKKEYIENSQLKIENGNWMLKSNSLLLRKKNSKWERYTIKCFVLTKELLGIIQCKDNLKYSYSLDIIFSKKNWKDDIGGLQFYIYSKD